MIMDYHICIIGEILCWQFFYSSSYYGRDVFVSGKAFHIQVGPVVSTQHRMATISADGSEATFHLCSRICLSQNRWSPTPFLSCPILMAWH